MNHRRTRDRGATRRLAALLAFAALCVGLTAAIGISTAGAKKATILPSLKMLNGCFSPAATVM